jgi:hypothetical protein
MAQYFNGKFLVQPQASVYVDDSRLANLNPGAANTLAIVGTCTGGVPQQAVLITDPNQARRVFRSGDLLDAALLAFDPSSQTGGASRIYCVRVNLALQAKAKVFDIINPVKGSGTLTVGGTPGAGIVYTATIAGVAIPYTASGGDTNITIAAAVANLINTSVNTTIITPFTGVTATSTGAVVTVTARYPGVDGNAITLVGAATSTGTFVASGGTLTGGTGNTLVTLVADDYGLFTNQLFYTIAAASVKGNKITLGLTTSGNIIGGSIVKDNLFRDLITIQYTGSGSACTLTVNDSTLTTSTTGAVADNLNIAFSTYTTVQQVVDVIAATGKYTVSLTAASSADLPSSGQFDPKTAQDIRTTAQTLTGNLQTLIDFLNGQENIFSAATRAVNPAAGTPGFNTNPLYFVGGSDGTSTTTDWTNSLAALQTQDVQIVVPISNSATIHAATLTHVNYMSTTGRKPRVCLVGGALNEYNAAGAVPTQTITDRAIPLNSPRASLCAPGVTIFDVLGNKVTKDSSFTAAMVGGMLSSVSAGTPLTHKYMSNIQALEVKFSPADLDTLLLNGVLPVEFVQGRGFRVCQSITTWLGARNFAKNEVSTVMAIDAVVRRVQDTLDDQLVGQKVAPETLAQAVSITETILKGCQIDGLIVGDANSPAFKSISARTDGGDTIRVQFQMSPAIPANYILISVSAVPYSGSVSTVS